MAKLLIEKTRVNKWGLATCYVRHKRKKYYISSLRIPVDHWDEERQVVTPGAFKAELINKAILEVRRRFDGWEYEDYTHEELKEKVNRLNLGMTGKEDRDRRDLVLEMKDYLNSRPELSPKTQENIRSALRVFLEFRPEATWQDLGDPAVYREWLAHVIDRGLTNRYWNSIFKLTRKFGEWLYRQNNVQFDPHSLDSLFMKEACADGTYLTLEELDKFRRVLKETKREKYVWSDFMFRALTGLRYSETVDLSEHNVVQENGSKFYLKVFLKKQTKKSKIPLHPEAYKIFKEADFHLQRVNRKQPYHSSGQYNKIVKTLAKRAGINATFATEQATGNTYRKTQGEKWKFLGSHTARRTWARHAYDRGVNIIMIQKYLQHSSIDTTMRYIGVDRDEVFEAFENSWEF